MNSSNRRTKGRSTTTNPKDGNNKENTAAVLARKEMEVKLGGMNERLDKLMGMIDAVQKNMTEDKVKEMVAAAMAEQAPRKPESTKSTAGYNSITDLEKCDRARMVVE
jgi:hypothetical protein